MSNPVPSSLALTSIADNALLVAATHRNNYSAIQTTLNALIAALSGGTSGQLLSAVDSTDVQWVNNITYRKATQKQVVNTTSNTDLLNGEITVAANALGTNGLLRLTAFGDAVNNTGSTQTAPRFQLKLGASTLIDSNAPPTAWASSATRFAWRATAEIMNTAATNTQWTSLRLEAMGNSSSLGGAGGTVPTIGEGSYLPINSLMWLILIEASGAVDTTSSQALALNVTLPVASASCDWTLKGALAEIR